MQQRISAVTLVVNDYDEAIEFYTEKLNFELLEDTPMGEGKRWVRVAPKGSRESGLLLAKAKNEEQSAHVGNQTGGRVGFFLFTDGFWRDYNRMIENEVCFVRAPSKEVYGTVAVFKDLYGNLWDFIEPKAES